MGITKKAAVARKSFRMALKVVLYREGDTWIAHCLELDLMGDGTTPKKATRALSKAILAQIKASVKHDCLDKLFVPADPKFWAMFATGKNVANGEVVIKPSIAPVTIEEIETRQHVENETAICDEDLVPV